MQALDTTSSFGWVPSRFVRIQQDPVTEIFRTSVHPGSHVSQRRACASRVREPYDRGCTMPLSTIHCPSNRIGICRGVDLLLEYGCLRGSEPAAQPATRDGRLSGWLLF